MSETAGKITVPEGKLDIIGYLKLPDSWRGDHGGTGYQMIAEQVKKVISDIDFTEDIENTVKRIARGIVEDVTAEQIKKMVKEQLKKMKESGDIFP